MFALAPHALHYVIVTIFAYALDHAKPESEFQAEQVQGVFGGPHTSSCEDANIFVIKASPGAFNHALYLLI
jgi:hypothetical protein